MRASSLAWSQRLFISTRHSQQNHSFQFKSPDGAAGCCGFTLGTSHNKWQFVFRLEKSLSHKKNCLFLLLRQYGIFKEEREGWRPSVCAVLRLILYLVRWTLVPPSSDFSSQSHKRKKHLVLQLPAGLMSAQTPAASLPFTAVEQLCFGSSALFTFSFPFQELVRAVWV